MLGIIIWQWFSQVSGGRSVGFQTTRREESHWPWTLNFVFVLFLFLQLQLFTEGVDYRRTVARSETIDSRSIDKQSLNARTSDHGGWTEPAKKYTPSSFGGLRRRRREEGGLKGKK